MCVLQWFIVIPCAAQYPSEVRVVKEPYEVNYYNNYDMSKKKIKDFIAYVEKDNGTKDTLRFERFNEKGELSQSIYLFGGKRQKIFHYSYYKSSIGPVVQYEEEDLKKKQITGVCIIQKNKLGQNIVETFMAINGKDTTSRSYKKFFYNEKNQLTRVEHILNKLNLAQNYFYERDRLIKLETRSGINMNNKQEIEYLYNNEGLPIAINHYLFTDTTKYLLKYNKYKYKDGLIAEEDYIGTNQFDKITKAKYQYAPDSTISKIVVQRDTFFKEIDYSFNNKKITSIKVRTNALTELNREYTTSSYFYLPSQLPATSEFKFLYDEYGNIITNSTYINDKFMGSSYQKITYYED